MARVNLIFTVLGSISLLVAEFLVLIREYDFKGFSPFFFIFFSVFCGVNCIGINEIARRWKKGVIGW